MNRIRQIREAAKLTQEQLAERVGTTANTISRLELGEQQLTQNWMERVSLALGCRPADLIANVVLAEIDGDVEAAHLDPVIAAAIGKKGLCTYLVTGRSVVEAGVKPGDTITVDESAEAIAAVKGLDVVLVEVGAHQNRSQVLRQFIPPNMLVTNRNAANIAITMGDPTVTPKIIGVVIRG